MTRPLTTFSLHFFSCGRRRLQVGSCTRWRGSEEPRRSASRLNAGRGGFGARWWDASPQSLDGQRHLPPCSPSPSWLSPAGLVGGSRYFARRRTAPPRRGQSNRAGTCGRSEDRRRHEVGPPPCDGQHEQRDSEHRGERCDAEHVPAQLKLFSDPGLHGEGAPHEPKCPGRDEGSSTAPQQGPGVAEAHRVGNGACEGWHRPRTRRGRAAAMDEARSPCQAPACRAGNVSEYDDTGPASGPCVPCSTPTSPRRRMDVDCAHPATVSNSLHSTGLGLVS